MRGSLPLRERLQQHGQSVQDFELAATDRFDDAITLLVGGRLLAAVYVLGYVAEIYLKNSVYRRLGARPTAQTSTYFRHARTKAKELELSQHADQWEGGHGLMYWARLLWSLPGEEGRTLGAAERRSLYRHVQRIESHWTVEMRYSTDKSSRLEAETVQASVEWIRRNRVALWR